MRNSIFGAPMPELKSIFSGKVEGKIGAQSLSMWMHLG